MSVDPSALAIIDEHPIIIEAVSALFLQRSHFRIVATGTTAADIADVGERLGPELIVLDLRIQGDAIAAIRAVAAAAPCTRFIVFSGSDDVDLAIAALDAGASGYVLKSRSTEELLVAADAVMRGETYISQTFAAKVIAALRQRRAERAPSRTRLSYREEQIVKLLLCGRKNKEIAAQLHLSEKTVKSYMTNLMQKLNARNRLEVVIAAQNLAVTEAPPQRTAAVEHA